MSIVCKKCGSSHYVKNGKVRGKQRYRCKECGYNFVEGDERVKVSPLGRALALLLYGTGRASYGFIAKLFNVSRTTVLYWIRSEVKKLPEPQVDVEIKEVQLDEICHFINKKNKKYGYGEPWIVLQTELSDGLLVIVLLKHLKDSTRKN